MRTTAWTICLAVLVLTAPSLPAEATFWYPVESACPVCEATNTFQATDGSGAEVFHWPSKFQFVIWPDTDPRVCYTCLHCRFSCFMDDFAAMRETLTDKQRDALAAALAGVEMATDVADYTAIPISDRLRAAETVYDTLGDRDDVFWTRFHRIRGFHLEREGRAEEAAAARHEAMRRAAELLTRSRRPNREKELRMVIGAMKYYTLDRAGALDEFRRAVDVRFSDRDLPVRLQQEMDKYLSGILVEYLEAIEPGITETLDIPEPGVLTSFWSSERVQKLTVPAFGLLFALLIGVLGFRRRGGAPPPPLEDDANSG